MIFIVLMVQGFVDLGLGFRILEFGGVGLGLKRVSKALR